MLKIVPFEEKYKDIFKQLNLAWLELYFHVEAKDQELLNDCEKFIINKEGFIFIGLWKAAPVACYSLLKGSEENGCYELGKMAVDKTYQGLKIGQKMLAHAIDFGKSNAWKKIELYSSTKLDTALYLYKKYGFREVILEANSPYKRSDIKMELIL
ncbi:GNAT family N-acetyltransferase [Maribacter sp. PR1]|uniref:GNAT family N-acetyltransferase n=1 Tax=Maribacter cobaltidurans TaxID=1178778 RepID=A0ABU7IVY8_9FLAO|nr:MULTISPECIES: GNAT family N-acetyltransferase [Maribacter]MDC6389718.1 GNAT family N-acetyltransferase [Maribacter sp. PR1]MEE1977108.1 GNAT family N-acetyltransferase [Maribacter cobaltidurans]